jgi:hypothetical protein
MSDRLFHLAGMLACTLAEFDNPTATYAEFRLSVSVLERNAVTMSTATAAAVNGTTTATAKKAARKAAKAAAAVLNTVPVAETPAAPNPHEMALLWQQCEEAYQKGRELYAQSDAFEDRIIAAVGVGNSIVLPNGQVLRVVDNFLDASGMPKRKHYAPAGVSRFEVKVK